MLTAGITAAVAGLLSLVGIKPGPYLVFVAIGVKIAIVAFSLAFGARWARRRAAAKALAAPAEAVEPTGRTSPGA